MSDHRLYRDLADFFPLVTPVEEYAEEAAQWRSLLRFKLGPARHTILDLGAGGGHNLSYIKADFEATATDISEEMLALSRRLNPEVEHSHGDMRTIRLGRTFKAVLVHDAISYMLSEDDVRAVLATAAAHLAPGGLLVLAPDHYTETFKGPIVDHHTAVRGDVELTFIEYTYDPDPADTTVEAIMFFLIREHGQLRIEQDHHTLGIFPMKRWFKLLEGAGFTAEKHPITLSNVKNPFWLIVGTYRGKR
jgi:SAM-dependent methyltransferase